MKTLSTTCIILGHKNFGEADKLIYLYIKELGKIKAIARGARKITSKFAGHLETTNFCKISLYFGPKNTIITEISSFKNFKTLRENLDKLNCALKIAEISNRVLMENQQLENLSELLETNLDHLAISQKPELITYSYLLKILDLAGLIPDFKSINTNMETKYLKFLNFIKTNSLKHIEKIKLENEEKQELDKIFDRIIQYAS